jgi:hypothetical protein
VHVWLVFRCGLFFFSSWQNETAFRGSSDRSASEAVRRNTSSGTSAGASVTAAMYRHGTGSAPCEWRLIHQIIRCEHPSCLSISVSFFQPILFSVPFAFSSFRSSSYFLFHCFFIIFFRPFFSLFSCFLYSVRGGYLSRSSDWLWAGRPRGQSSSPARVKNFLFSTLSRLAFGPPPQGAKRPEHEADHSPPTSAEVKKMWIYISIPTYAFMA